jgi:hypothetical protein
VRSNLPVRSGYSQMEFSHVLPVHVLPVQVWHARLWHARRNMSMWPTPNHPAWDDG